MQYKPKTDCDIRQEPNWVTQYKSVTYLLWKLNQWPYSILELGFTLLESFCKLDLYICLEITDAALCSINLLNGLWYKTGTQLGYPIQKCYLLLKLNQWPYSIHELEYALLKLFGKNPKKREKWLDYEKLPNNFWAIRLLPKSMSWFMSRKKLVIKEHSFNIQSFPSRNENTTFEN